MLEPEKRRAISENRKAIRNSWLPAEKGALCSSVLDFSREGLYKPFAADCSHRFSPQCELDVSGEDDAWKQEGFCSYCISNRSKHNKTEGLESTSPISCRSDVHFYFGFFSDTFPSQLYFPAELFTFLRKALWQIIFSRLFGKSDYFLITFWGRWEGTS